MRNMDNQSSCATQAQLIAEDGFYYGGRYPQAVACPQAEAAMGDVPNELGYYRSRYDGKFYAKLYCRGEGVYSDGTPMVMGEKRFFEVQPIRWYPFAIGEGKSLLVSECVLFTRPYDDKSNDWGDSYLREELQNFALGCLDARTKGRIVELPLDNDCVGLEVAKDGKRFVLDPDAAPWCVQAVTWDGVFVLSRAEWQGLQNELRPFAPTDYAKAMGAMEQPNGFGTGWLRTADSAADRAAVFGFDDEALGAVALNTGAVVTREMGVVPVLSVRL